MEKERRAYRVFYHVGKATIMHLTLCEVDLYRKAPNIRRIERARNIDP